MFKIIMLVVGIVMCVVGAGFAGATNNWTLCLLGVGLLGIIAAVEISTLRSRSAKRREMELSALREYRFPATVREVFRRENPHLTKSQEDLAFEGLKQYFALMLLERRAGRFGSLGMPSVLVDEAWHAFVLCTEDYGKFCDQFFGQMVHHYPDPKARPGRLTGNTPFKDDVLNTWSAFGRGRDAYPEHFTTMNNVPLLFALDSQASPTNGWVWTEPALSALARQVEQRQEAERKADSRSGSESAGSSCGGACFTSMPSVGASSLTSSSHTSPSSSLKSSSGKHHDDGGSSCSSKSSGSNCTSKSSGSNCGSNCKSDTDTGGSSCGSSCGGGSGCGGGD